MAYFRPEQPSYTPTPAEIRMACQRIRIGHLKKKREQTSGKYDGCGQSRYIRPVGVSKRWNGLDYLK